ncbi:hypothetical protein HK102_012197 [Quaeritorhiza haematococci]|nr:hypothetical protein HK102_012197 [Quaeritorhiza haematococci]
MSAIDETLRLILDENIDIFMGDLNYELTFAEAPLLDYASLLHCSSTSNALVTETSGWARDSSIPNTISTVPPPEQYGTAALYLLSILPIRNIRIVLMYENTIECKVPSLAFMSVFRLSLVYLLFTASMTSIEIFGTFR